MVITPHTIWEVPAYLPYVHPKLLPRTVLLAEKRLKVRVPQDYLELLEVQNGGIVRFVYRNAPHRMLWGIGPQLPSLLWHWGDEILPNSVWLPKDVRRLFPFDGNAYSYLCLDYRGCEFDGEPQVTLVALDEHSESVIAPTFAQFLTMLERTHCHVATFGVLGEWTRQRATEALSRIMDRDADQLRTHGYEYSRLQPASGEWIFISDNLAPRAYDKPQYPELNEQLAGEALRYPEYPDVRTFIECSTDARATTIDLCRRAEIEIVPLT